MMHHHRSPALSISNFKSAVSVYDGCRMHLPSSIPAIRGIDRWLHPLYRRITGMREWLMLRVRPAGIGVMAVLVLAACLTIGHERAATRQLLAAAGAMSLISLSWVMLRRAKVSAVRELPRVASVGVPLRFDVVIRNDGSRPLRRAWWMERSADASPTMEDFCLLREPGEHERNRFDRTFAWFRWQWLMWRNRTFRGGMGDEEIRLPPGGTMRVTVEWTPLRRGVIEFSDARLLLPDPFGLLQRCLRVRAGVDRITVFPARHSLPSLDLPGAESWRNPGESESDAIGDHGGFTGLREYQPGDPLRRIHWRSWAKIGRPIVKELEERSRPRHALLLDPCGEDPSGQAFEACVSVAASFAMLADDDQGSIDLIMLQDGLRVVRAGDGNGGSEVLLEALAGVTMQHEGALDSLADAVCHDATDRTSCLVILHDWNDARAAFLNKLRMIQIPVVPLIVGMGERPAGVPGHWLDWHHLARDLMKLPPRLDAEDELAFTARQG
jgi:uncharacterized protein (DUF58 family)